MVLGIKSVGLTQLPLHQGDLSIKARNVKRPPPHNRKLSLGLKEEHDPDLKRTSEKAKRISEKAHAELV